ncbi:3'-5' exonuclease [uncultured Bacteroides sp.]|jgi:ribonuclease D|uniref:3'-5' exonuclease n=1 Tax=uncultured Bacteroides sp. TaxID=162156 RepID=UPI002AA9525B|nr:3'-5' exonuclease [uncultured Bacteroides sp.]
MIVKRTITKDDISEMPKVNFEGKIIMICTEKDAERAVDFLSKYPVLGIDSETKPSFVKGKSHKVSLLQISTDQHCFLFRLNLIGFPNVLIGLLENQSIVKVGLSLKDDFMAMHRRVTFKQQNCVELQEFVKPFGIQDKSLQKIYAILFGHKISKSQRLSNWEAETLSPSQQLYAATDAWTCLKIYNLLQDLHQTGDYVKEEIVEPVIEEKE